MYSKILSILLVFCSINLIAQHEINIGSNTGTYLSFGDNEFVKTESNTYEISKNRALKFFFNEKEGEYSGSRAYGILEGDELVLPMIFSLEGYRSSPSGQMYTGGATGLFDFQQKKWSIPLFNGELREVAKDAYLASPRGDYRGLISKNNEVILDSKYQIIERIKDLDNYVKVHSRNLSQIGIYNVVAKKFTFQGDYASIEKIEGRNYFLVKNYKWEFNICDINGNLKLKNWCSKIKKNDKNPNLYIVEKDNQYGVVSINGEIKIPIELKKLRSVYAKDDSYCAQNKAGKFGLIRLNGMETLPFEYDIISDRSATIENGTDRILICSKEGKFGTISIGKGVPKAMIACAYENIAFSKEALIAKKKGKFGLIDFYGTEKTKFIYDTIITTKSEFLIGTIKKKQYLINPENQTDTPNPYDKIADIKGIYNPSSTDASFSTEKLFKVRKKEKYAIVSEAGEELSSFSFDNVLQRLNSVVAVQNNGKQGLYSLKTKSLIVPCEYDFINLIKLGNYALKDGKLFSISIEDTAIVEEVKWNKKESSEAINYYDESRYTTTKSEGNLEFVKFKGRSKEYGFLNNKELILPIIFSKKRASDAGYTVLGFGDNYSLFNLKTQTWALPFGFTHLEGIADEGIYRAKRNKAYGLIDKDNNVLLDFKWVKIETLYGVKGYLKLTKYEGFEKRMGIYSLKEKKIITKSLYSEISVADKERFNVTNQEGKSNTIDRNGNVQLKSWYTSLKPEKNGDNFIAQINDKVAIIDKNQQNLVPFDYYSIQKISHKDSCYLAQDLNDKYLFFDTNGKLLFPRTFDLIKSLNYNIYLTKSAGKYGLLKVEKNGISEILACEYDEVYFERENYYFEKDGKQGFFRKNYETKTDLLYDEIKPISSTLLIGKIKEELFLISHNKIPVKDIAYAQLEPIFEKDYRRDPFNYIKFTKEGNPKFGVLNSSGDLLIQAMFDDVISAKDDILIVKNNGKIGLFRVSTNKNILPFEYDSIVYTTNGFYAVKGKEHYLISVAGELVFNRL